MKYTDMIDSNSQAVRYIKPKSFNHQLTELDILSLQDAFLINGFHSIHFTDQTSGRAIINNFLLSLPMHKQVGCLTLDNAQELPKTIFDIYASFNGHDEQAIEEFFINEFYFDFVWIEISPELIQAPWFGYFCKIMEAYSQKMPIVKVYYRE